MYVVGYDYLLPLYHLHIVCTYLASSPGLIFSLNDNENNEHKKLGLGMRLVLTYHFLT